MATTVGTKRKGGSFYWNPCPAGCFTPADLLTTKN